MLAQILGEKENYISNLENEISEMRKEIDSQRDAMILHEMNTIADTSRGAQT